MLTVRWGGGRQGELVVGWMKIGGQLVRWMEIGGLLVVWMENRTQWVDLMENWQLVMGWLDNCK